MAKPKPGMGRGPERDPVGLRPGRRGFRGGAAPAAGRADRAEPATAAAQLRRGLARRRSPRSLVESGVLQPVLVRPKAGGHYELVAGERRWRAARIAELETIPALVRAREDSASLELALIENMAREDLSPIEEARACAAPGRGARADPRGGRSEGRPQPRRREQPDATARASRRGRSSCSPRDVSARVTGGPCCWPRTTASAGASRAKRSPRSWSVRTLEERARASNGGRPAGRQGRCARRPIPISCGPPRT